MLAFIQLPSELSNTHILLKQDQICSLSSKDQHVCINISFSKKLYHRRESFNTNNHFSPLNPSVALTKDATVTYRVELVLTKGGSQSTCMSGLPKEQTQVPPSKLDLELSTGHDRVRFAQSQARRVANNSTSIEPISTKSSPNHLGQLHKSPFFSHILC